MRTPLLVGTAALIGSCLVCAGAGAAMWMVRRASPPSAWVGGARVRASLSCPEARAATDAAILDRRAIAHGIGHEVRVLDERHLEVTLDQVSGPDVLRALLDPSRLELTEVLDGAVQVDALSLPPGVTPSSTPTGAMGWHASEPGPLEAIRSGAPPGAGFGISCNEHGGARDCEAMYLRQPAAMGNADVESAAADVDETTGQPRVLLRFTPEGSARFALLTRGLVQRRLAIVVDGVVLSAPVVIEEISGGAAQITMGGGAPPEALFADARALAVALDVGEPLGCAWQLETLE
jgi:hypothetical protein